MRRTLEFLIGCLTAPSFVIATFLAYLKVVGFVSTTLDVQLLDVVQGPLSQFNAFINSAYLYVFILPIEQAASLLGYFLQLTGIRFDLHFPPWYPTAAYFSTLLYGAQAASMKLFKPLTGNALDASPEVQIGDWQRAALALVWNFILLIYIPVNSIARGIHAFLNDYENLSARSVSRLFKIVVLGFLMVGFLFLLHDILSMLFRWRDASAQNRQHKLFHLSLIHI